MPRAVFEVPRATTNRVIGQRPPTAISVLPASGTCPQCAVAASTVQPAPHLRRVERCPIMPPHTFYEARPIGSVADAAQGIPRRENKVHSRKWSVVISVLGMALLLLSACGGSAAPPTTVPTQIPRACGCPGSCVFLSEVRSRIPEPTETPARSPLGSAENRIVVAGIDSLNPTFDEAVRDRLMEQTGYNIDNRVFLDSAELVESLTAGETHVLIASPAAYLVASERYGFDVALVGTRQGGPAWHAVMLAGADTGITSLADVAGRSVCWINPGSLSGYEVPRLMLAAVGIDPQTDLGQETEVLGHEDGVRLVHNGDCEVGATFSDARKLVERELPDVYDRVLVIAESPPIPSVSVSFARDVPDDVRQGLIDAFQAIVQTDEGMDTVMMAHGWEGVELHDDSIFEPLRDLLRAAGAEVDSLL